MFKITFCLRYLHIPGLGHQGLVGRLALYPINIFGKIHLAYVLLAFFAFFFFPRGWLFT